MDERILVRIARALADETRVKLLGALAEGNGDATVSDLATRCDLPQPRVSTHLTVLRNAFSALCSLSPEQEATPRRSKQASHLVEQNAPIRRARTCYEHLAGVAGVTLLEQMLRRGWLTQQEEGPRLRYALTAEGAEALERRGVAIRVPERARRQFATGCVDWTERKPHLGGALGAAILVALCGAGIVERGNDTRVVTLARPLERWLDRS